MFCFRRECFVSAGAPPSGYSRWIMLRMNLGTTSPWRQGLTKGLFLMGLYMAVMTLTMKKMMRFRSKVMTAVCARMPAFFSPRILGLSRMQRSSLAAELVLSEAERRALIF